MNICYFLYKENANKFRNNRYSYNYTPQIIFQQRF